MEGTFGLFLLCVFAVQHKVSATEVNRGHTASKSGSSLFFYQDQLYPRDCLEVQEQCSTRNATGAHLVRPDGYHEPFWVFCSGEWTVILRRVDGFLDFNRNWAEYQNGFGYLNAEHWLGNEKLSQLTNQKIYELRIEFQTRSGQMIYISYDKFRINDEFGDYRLVSLGQRNGNAVSGFIANTSEVNSRDCYGILKSGQTASRDYTIQPYGWTREAFAANCNMTIDGGGWTVIQRRIHSSSLLNFDHNWETYKYGFGNPSGEFWIGNEQMYYLTNQKEYELRIDMVNKDRNSYYAKYDFFRINDETDKYRLSGLGDMTGTAAFDALRYNLGVPFSTTDRDSDLHENPSYNCADNYNDGWWHYKCSYMYANLNNDNSIVGYWYYLPGNDNLLYIEMKIRPKHANL